jgi:uncharacterized protein YdhG (YjbR/CyaY superfamily)
MAKTDFDSVAQYLAAQPANVRASLRRVRNAIRKAIPEAEETISYQIPTYKLHGRGVLYFAGWKEHYSLYPAPDPVVKAFARELAGYEIRRGTIRFPLSEPVPEQLIARIAKLRARAVAESAKAKPVAAKRRRGTRSPAASRRTTRKARATRTRRQTSRSPR